MFTGKWKKYIIVSLISCVIGVLVYLLIHQLEGGKTPDPNSVKNGETPTESITAVPTTREDASLFREGTLFPTEGTPIPTDSMSPITTVGASPTPYIEELVVGFENAEYGKETPSQKIAYRCPSFVNNGDKLIVDVYVGDSSYKYHQEFGGEPSYDTYGQNGYPNLQVYSCDTMYMRTVQFNNKALINGRLNKYLRIFTKDEMSLLELARDEDVSHGKHETVEIDFSNYEADSYGRIAFSFSWDFGEQPVEGTDWKGRRQWISFYVGKNGVSVAYSEEEAFENYRNRFRSDFGAIDVDSRATHMWERLLSYEFKFCHPGRI